jgi:hypothetical protein
MMIANIVFALLNQTIKEVFFRAENIWFPDDMDHMPVPPEEN